MGPQGPPGPVQRVDGGVSIPAEPAEKVSIILTEACQIMLYWFDRTSGSSGTARAVQRVDKGISIPVDLAAKVSIILTDT